MDNIEEIMQAISIVFVVGGFLCNTGRGIKAIELFKEGLVLLNNKALEKEKHLSNFFFNRIYFAMFNTYYRNRDYKNAAQYGRKLLFILRQCGQTIIEGMISLVLAYTFQKQNKPTEAKELYETAIEIMNKTGNRKQEAVACEALAYLFKSLFDYEKAKEYYQKALKVHIEIGDRQEEADAYGNLGNMFESLAEYDKAKEYLEKAIVISIEIGDRQREGNAYGNLGQVFTSLAEYDKAKEYLEKALAIQTEIGNKKEEATSYGSLGTVFKGLGEYDKAEKYFKKALTISIQIGDKKGEASSYGNLATVFRYLAKYDKAKECYDKALPIIVEIGDREKEAGILMGLGCLSLTSLADYNKATEYLKKALAIVIEIGDKQGQANAHGNLGALFRDLGEYDKAKKHYETALAIAIETDDRQNLAKTYLMLGSLSLDRCKYPKAEENIRNALALATEIEDRDSEACCYLSLGRLFEEIGDLPKAKEHFEKALTLEIEIGNRQVEGACYTSLGHLYTRLGENVKAEEYHEKSFSISKNIGALEMEWMCSYNLACGKRLGKKSQEAFSYLFNSIKTSEVCRGLLKDNDKFKILHSDKNMVSLKLLSKLFFDAGNPKKALYAEELGRARALSDLMAAQYSVESHISADPQSWTGTENFVNLESDCTCLYISYTHQNVFLWILKASGDIQNRTLTIDKNTLHAKLAENLDEYFAKIADESFRSFGILPEENCEDRSLNDTESKPDSSHQENLPVLREAKNEVDPKPSLTLFYQMIIAPVVNLLETSEIIIVPERSLFRVPFPALLDGKGKYLSETFRIRIVPSLTTLKLIQDSPADYHSETGALIVGDPDVGKVILKGKCETFKPLPCARNEAEMIGQWLGVKPLLGKHATKQAVLQRIHSVSLVHLAAHGNAERGEIALAPERTGRGIPQEEDYLLTMSDISKVQLRAKLVVLSCCHSALGQIRAEGVIGIARAFLGSGARSVLVSLWALKDSATKHFMRRFYKNLIRGKSASESLHQSMKWMRDHGFSDVSEWAPFLLIGDDVTFVFENVSTVI